MTVKQVRGYTRTTRTWQQPPQQRSFTLRANWASLRCPPAVKLRDLALASFRQQSLQSVRITPGDFLLCRTTLCTEVHSCMNDLIRVTRYYESKCAKRRIKHARLASNMLAQDDLRYFDQRLRIISGAVLIFPMIAQVSSCGPSGE